MIKLTIDKKEEKRFKLLFKFFLENNCELCLFPDGLKWRNGQANGIIYKKAFKFFPVEHKRKLGLLKGNNKSLLSWFKTWKENKELSLIEIPLG